MNVLVTGGAGFIGSNLAQALVDAGHSTRVLDDLSTGFLENVPAKAELIEGDVADAETVAKAVKGVEVVFHLAAHRAVFRSVEHPLTTDTVNVHGTLNVLKASADSGVRRVVSASSSSVYGGAAKMPTPEDEPLWPRSPYAVTKLAGEHYCRVFSELFGLETVSLRYFNVFGPRQRPDSAYAAVIPLFMEALRSGAPPTVHGDGRQSRAFVYVADAVAANLAAATAPAASCRGQAYNVAGRRSVDLLELLAILGRIFGTEPQPVHVAPRPGDVRHTSADVSAAAHGLGFEPEVDLEEGLRRTVEWFSTLAGGGEA
ncbi:MAG TPA: NAD-dependent epimerase/dehydratase family protein [Acidimicrobiales bacterium]|nr:NAD-dependent epimerase/dehydratase family protein [Acidimicrobiales bacterium]